MNPSAVARHPQGGVRQEVVQVWILCPGTSLLRPERRSPFAGAFPPLRSVESDRTKSVELILLASRNAEIRYAGCQPRTRGRAAGENTNTDRMRDAWKDPTSCRRPVALGGKINNPAVVRVAAQVSSHARERRSIEIRARSDERDDACWLTGSGLEGFPETPPPEIDSEVVKFVRVHSRVGLSCGGVSS